MAFFLLSFCFTRENPQSHASPGATVRLMDRYANVTCLFSVDRLIASFVYGERLANSQALFQRVLIPPAGRPSVTRKQSIMTTL